MYPVSRMVAVPVTLDQDDPMRTRRATRHPLTGLVLAGLAATAASWVATGPARAAIPARGTVIEGIGPAALPIGSTEARMRARWGRLVCRPVAGFGADASPERRCYNSLRRALSWIDLEGDRRVAGFTWTEPGWKTTRGVGVGSRIAQVTRAYGRRSMIRRTPVWTYFEIVRKVRGQTRVTGFIGRTKVGDIVTMYVVRRRLEIVRPQPAVLPPGAPLDIALMDFPPLARVELEIKLPWLTRPETIGETRIGRNGIGRLLIPSGGTVASLLARRPAGTTGTVRARIRQRAALRPQWVNLGLQVPAPPSIVTAPGPLSGDVAGSVTLNGLEAQGRYTLTAEWTCPSSGAPESRNATTDLIPMLEGGGSQVVAVDSPTFAFAMFGSVCAGPAPPAQLPVTLVLSRATQGSAPLERSATLVTAVSRPT